MLRRLAKGFILWGVRRTPGRPAKMRNGDGKFNLFRFQFLWPDETILNGKHLNRPPWWRPFNAFLHCWRPRHDGEEFHDHPRWSITIVLRGRIVELTPWHSKILKPGSVVIRSRKAIHSFRVPDGYRGKTWTLFIVGRRNHRQHIYRIHTLPIDSTLRKPVKA